MGKQILRFGTALSAIVFAGMLSAAQGETTGTLSAPEYPGSAKEQFNTETTGEIFYAKDPVEKVKAFYEKKLGVSLQLMAGSIEYCDSPKPDADKACFTILTTGPDGKDVFSLMRDEQIRESTGLPVNKEFLAATKQYDYLTRSFFALSDQTDESSIHRELPAVLYEKYVGPVDKEQEGERQESGHKSRKNKKDPDEKQKEAERKQTKAKIKQLKAEGKNDEARALSMQQLQDNQGDYSAAMAAASQAQDEQTKKDDQKKQAYMKFLQELAKQPAYATKIVIRYVVKKDGRDYTSQNRASGKSTGLTINKLRGLIGR